MSDVDFLEPTQVEQRAAIRQILDDAKDDDLLAFEWRLVDESNWVAWHGTVFGRKRDEESLAEIPPVRWLKVRFSPGLPGLEVEEQYWPDDGQVIYRNIILRTPARLTQRRVSPPRKTVTSPKRNKRQREELDIDAAVPPQPMSIAQTDLEFTRAQTTQKDNTQVFRDNAERLLLDARATNREVERTQTTRQLTRDIAVPNIPGEGVKCFYPHVYQELLSTRDPEVVAMIWKQDLASTMQIHRSNMTDLGNIALSIATRSWILWLKQVAQPNHRMTEDTWTAGVMNLKAVHFQWSLATFGGEGTRKIYERISGYPDLDFAKAQKGLSFRK